MDISLQVKDVSLDVITLGRNSPKMEKVTMHTDLDNNVYLKPPNIHKQKE